MVALRSLLLISLLPSLWGAPIPNASKASSPAPAPASAPVKEAAAPQAAAAPVSAPAQTGTPTQTGSPGQGTAAAPGQPASATGDPQGANQAAPAPAPAPAPPPPPADPGRVVDLSPSDAAIKAVGGLYSLSIQNGPADAAILALAKSAKVDVDIVSPADDLITISFHDLPFQKALERILRVADLKYREQDGLYVIGLSVDLQLMFPTSTEKELDAVYRCRHLDSDSLAQALAKVLPPQVKITQGPRYMSPGLDSGNDPSGLTGDQGLRALTATDLTFKVHDILLSGPADMVRRGITLARRFDRLRKQVRINIRVAEVEDNNVQNLGLSWMQSLNLSAKEQATSSDGTLVDGIRLGKFSHSPLVVNATLNALETKGKSKTLANPSLLLMDGERSFILSGQKLLYPKFTGKDQSGQSIYDVAELRVGIYLQVAVQIGLNNDIVMSIIPQVTNVVSFTNYNNGQYPTVSTREAQTTVHAVSGEMVVLGGLKSTLDSEDKDGIPFLKDIPVLGRLFSSTNKTNNKSELMIFLTPEIMNDPEEAKVPVKISRGEDH